VSSRKTATHDWLCDLEEAEEKVIKLGGKKKSGVDKVDTARM